MQTATYFHATDPTVTFAAGDVIFSEGEPGLETFGVLDGEVELRSGPTTTWPASPSPAGRR